MSHFHNSIRKTIKTRLAWLPWWLRVVVGYPAAAAIVFILVMLFVLAIRWLASFFGSEIAIFVELAVTCGDVIRTFVGDGMRVSRTLGAGGIAAGYSIVQLTTLLTLEPLLRCGAKRWVLGYAALSALIAGGTYCQFHDLEAIQGMGNAGPVIVGLFYPAVLFRLLGKFDIAASEGNPNDAQQVHANLLAIFVAGIRRNSLRYWAYVSSVLDELTEPQLLRLLLGVLSNPTSMRDSGKREQLFKKAQAELDRWSLSDLQMAETSPAPSDIANGPDADSEATDTDASLEPPGQSPPSDSQLKENWSKWTIIEKFHLLGSPELVLDAVEPEAEALWLIGHMPLGEQCQLALEWFDQTLGDEDRQTLKKVICNSGVNSSAIGPPALAGDSEFIDHDPARLLIRMLIRRYATREFYDNIVCDYRKRRFRCWGLPSACWKRRRSGAHCTGCDGQCPQCKGKTRKPSDPASPADSGHDPVH